MSFAEYSIQWIVVICTVWAHFQMLLSSQRSYPLKNKLAKLGDAIAMSTKDVFKKGNLGS